MCVCVYLSVSHLELQLDSYAIFDWDNLFASLLAGLENKEVAYSNLFQVVKTKTAAGFIPNFSAGGASSQDRTEPPVGAKVVLELFKKYGDKWMVEVVFDDLLDWNSWFLRRRVLKPAGLIALGSFNAEAAAQGQGQGGSNNMQDVSAFEWVSDDVPFILEAAHSPSTLYVCKRRASSLASITRQCTTASSLTPTERILCSYMTLE